MSWKYQYDEYYSEMEKEFEKYEEQNLDPEIEEAISRDLKKNG